MIKKTYNTAHRGTVTIYCDIVTIEKASPLLKEGGILPLVMSGDVKAIDMGEVSLEFLYSPKLREVVNVITHADSDTAEKNLELVEAAEIVSSFFTTTGKIFWSILLGQGYKEETEDNPTMTTI